MYLLIRDDDVNCFTDPTRIEKLYGPIYRRCPVTFGVIAFQDADVPYIVPPELRGSGTEFELTRRGNEIVAYLQERMVEGLLAIAQHGATHAYIGGAPECATACDRLHANLNRANDYLSSTFSVEIETFIPPNNKLSLETAKWLGDKGMTIMGVPSFRWLAYPGSHFSALAQRVISEVLFHRPSMQLLYAAGTEFIPCEALTPAVSFSALAAKLRLGIKHGDLFCIATHSWELHRRTLDDIVLAEALDRLVDIALEAGAKPAMVKDLVPRA